MWSFHNNSNINNISNFESSYYILILPPLIMLLMMKVIFLLTIAFHRLPTSKRCLLRKTHIIWVQFVLWLLIQIGLYGFISKMVVINFNVFHFTFIYTNTSLLTWIALLHFLFCLSFLVIRNKQWWQVVHFVLLLLIAALLVIRLNLLMIDLSWRDNHHFFTVFNMLFCYYLLLIGSWKMFRNNLATIIALLCVTIKTIITKRPLPKMKIMPYQLINTHNNSKKQMIVFLWQFENYHYYVALRHQSQKRPEQRQKLLQLTVKKNFVYACCSLWVVNISKPLQMLKTLINGWQSREIK